MEAAENPILKWAVDLIAHAPPMQNVVAFLIVFLLALPLIRAGWKEFRSAKQEAAPTGPPPAMIQETPWFIQTVTRIQFDIEEMKKQIEGLKETAEEILSKLQRRSPRQKKK